MYYDNKIYQVKSGSSLLSGFYRFYYYLILTPVLIKRFGYIPTLDFRISIVN